MNKIVYLLPIIALCACSRDTSKDANESKSTPDTLNIQADRPNGSTDPIVIVGTETNGELAAHQVELPDVPDSLNTHEARADYMLLHFWDKMRFDDDSMIKDTLLVEQTFSNFIELLPYTSSINAQQQAVDRLMKQTSINPESYRYIMEVANKYLYDSDSPFQNVEMYRLFINTSPEGKAGN